MRTRAWLLAPLVLSACSGFLTEPGEVVDLTGRWTLNGTQDAPVLQLTGTLTITQASAELSGSASLTETLPNGEVRLLAGPITGRAIGSEDTDFEVGLATGSRRHVARIVADTMNGVWVQQGSGGLGNVSGSFRAVRSR